MTLTLPVSHPRWPWILGAALAVIVVWQLESRSSSARARHTDEGHGHRCDGRGGPAFAGPRWKPRAAFWRVALPPVRSLIRVSGRVLDAETAEPVTGVEVVFADGTTEASVTSDIDGSYTIEVPAGRFRPFVRSDGVLSVGKPRRKRLIERPRAEQIAASTLALAPELAVFHDLSGADLEVVRSAVIRGRVLDRAGHPIAGAMVQAGLIEDDGGQSVLGTDVDETDTDGRFRLAVAAKAHQFEAFHDRFGASRP